MIIQPTLSVIMTNYNHSQYIADALDSILAQSYQPLEIIIIDDASTDNSLEILEDYARQYPLIRILHNEHNMGALYNVTRLVEMAKGAYFNITSADDKILPGLFEKSMKLLAQYPQAGLCSSLTRIIDVKGSDKGGIYMPVILNKGGFIPPDKALSMMHRHGSWIQGNTSILRRHAITDCGGYIPELHSFCDGFLYQVIAVKYGVCYIPEELASWRRLESSYSATIGKDKKLSLQIIRHAKKLMSSTYRDLFPSDFVDCWEKKELLNNRLVHFLDLQNAALEDLQQTILSQGLMDKCLFGLRKLFTRIEYIFLKSYLYYRAGLPASQLFVQRLKYFWRHVSNS